MALVPCLECTKEIGSSVSICPHCGSNQKELLRISKTKKMMENKDKVPFYASYQLYAFFFGPIYFAGYGKLRKGIILQIISLPVIGLFVGIYCLSKAKKELPIGEIPFNWKKASIVIFILILQCIWYTYAEIKKEERENKPQSLIQIKNLNRA